MVPHHLYLVLAFPGMVARSAGPRNFLRRHLRGSVECMIHVIQPFCRVGFQRYIPPTQSMVDFMM